MLIAEKLSPLIKHCQTIALSEAIILDAAREEENKQKEIQEQLALARMQVITAEKSLLWTRLGFFAAFFIAAIAYITQK
jgi:hypothetical protein